MCFFKQMVRYCTYSQHTHTHTQKSQMLDFLITQSKSPQEHFLQYHTLQYQMLCFKTLGQRLNLNTCLGQICFLQCGPTAQMYNAIGSIIKRLGKKNSLSST